MKATTRFASIWMFLAHGAILEHVSLSELVARALTEYLKKGARQ